MKIAKKRRNRKENAKFAWWLLLLGLLLALSVSGIRFGVESVDRTLDRIDAVVWGAIDAADNALMSLQREGAYDAGTQQTGSATTLEPQAGSHKTDAIDANDALIIDFIDVGQADCIFARCGEETMLIDAGNTGDGYLVAHYLSAEYGVTELDYFICTHAHEDHIGGADEIFWSGIYVDAIMLPMTDADTKAYKSLTEAAEEYRAEYLIPMVGDIYALGNATFTVLCCDSAEDLNQSSIVIRLSYGDIDCMLTGDATVACEYEMLDRDFPLDCEILKASHHGSLTSNSEQWLDAVSPEIIVISVGADNSYNLPNPTVTERYAKTGAEIYRTDVLGTIRIVTDGASYTVSAYDSHCDAQAA